MHYLVTSLQAVCLTISNELQLYNVPPYSMCLCQTFLKSPPLAKTKAPIGGGLSASDNRRQSSRRSLSVGDHGDFNNTSFAADNNDSFAIDNNAAGAGGGLLAGLSLGTPDYQETQTYNK